MSEKLTPERIQELQDCFSILKPNILYYKRPSTLSLVDMEFIFPWTKKYLDDNSYRKMIMDLTDTSLPSLQERKQGRILFQELKPKLDHLVVIAPSSFFLVALRFVVNNIDDEFNISTVETLDEALALLNTKRD